MQTTSKKDAEIKRLQKTLEEKLESLNIAQETLDAIRNGTVDGIVRSTPKGDQIFVLKGSDEPYRNLIEEMNEAAVLLSEDNSILYSNAGFAKLVDAHLEKVIGTQVQEWVSAASIETLMQLIGESRKGETKKRTLDVTFQTSKHEFVPTQVSVNKVLMGSVNTVGLIATNLTEHMEEEVKRYTASLEKEISRRRDAELELLEARKLAEQDRSNLYTVLETLPNAVVIFENFNKEFIYANKQVKGLFGFDIIGLRLDEFIDRIKPKWLDGSLFETSQFPINLAVHGQKVHDIEMTFKRTDGKDPILSVSVAPMVNVYRIIFAAVAVFTDITHRKGAENELKEAQAKLQEYANNLEQLVEERTKKLQDAERLATIGATAGMVGHDIRNPLQAIISDVYLAESDIQALSPSAEKKSALGSLKEIQKNADYINKIVADLQDYSRVLKPTIKETNLNKLCIEILRANVPKQVEATCRIGNTAKVILSDPALLQRILYNLVTNAVQSMPNGGKLTIEAMQEDDDVVITVQDTGVGIPDEVKPKLFTPLFTTRAKGQGFGLVVIKRMTEALGGAVSFESEVGKGTKFIVRLPLQKS